MMKDNASMYLLTTHSVILMYSIVKFEAILHNDDDPYSPAFIVYAFFLSVC